MGTSHAGPHPDAPRISKRDCATPGCGRFTARAGFCGVCRDNFVKGNAIVWSGGELLAQTERRTWYDDLISKEIIH